jgi:hypothetical protein
VRHSNTEKLFFCHGENLFMYEFISTQNADPVSASTHCHEAAIRVESRLYGSTFAVISSSHSEALAPGSWGAFAFVSFGNFGVAMGSAIYLGNDGGAQNRIMA